MGGHPVVYSVFNTNNKTIYIFTQETNWLRQKRQNKQRKAKEELKQSTNSYKFYCGVEIKSARYFKKVRGYFQPSLRIVLIETIENIFFVVLTKPATYISIVNNTLKL